MIILVIILVPADHGKADSPAKAFDFRVEGHPEEQAISKESYSRFGLVYADFYSLSDLPTPMNIPYQSKNVSVLVSFMLVAAFSFPASSALAGSFSFSTGDPNALIGTLSRVGSAGNMQTETADDFVLTENTIIQQATFTGLIPSGASLSDITQVEVEFYHVFPVDSTNPPSGNAPLRDDSPSDVAISSATSDSMSGTLTFSATLLNATFTATNSVVNEINPSPNQTTLGEGPVTGQEVSITVTFNPPISLPADHYFFRPEVLLTSGDFLWLSAPDPIVAPGTPFSPDFETWIRNDALAPDWLRVGTDITTQGPFNASFSLSGELDADGDGVPDAQDQCPDTAADAVVDGQGCSLEQLVPCEGPASGGTWKNHGQYVSTFTHTVQQFVAQGLIGRKEKGKLVSQAARSNCGKPSSSSNGHKGKGKGRGRR